MSARRELTVVPTGIHSRFPARCIVLKLLTPNPFAHYSVLIAVFVLFLFLLLVPRSENLQALLAQCYGPRGIVISPSLPVTFIVPFRTLKYCEYLQSLMVVHIRLDNSDGRVSPFKRKVAGSEPR